MLRHQGRIDDDILLMIKDDILRENSEVMEIVIPKVGWIDDDILLTIKDDILREKLLNINLLIANIEALNDNPTPSFDFMTKSSSSSLNSLLEETNTFDNSLPEFETFCFDLEEITQAPNLVKNPSASAIAGEATGDGTVSGIMGDEIGEGTIEGVREIGSERDDHLGDDGV
nr:hypothetical protein [Tanacetum cinerariifolium]